MSFQVIQQRTPGASHKRIDKECQDYLDSIKYNSDGTVIMAVADGHGSDKCPYSKEGAQKAVEAFKTILADYYKDYIGKPNELNSLMTLLNREGDTKIAQKICICWEKKILDLHGSKNREVPVTAEGRRDNEAIWKLYGTTLLGLMVTPDFVFAFQIGDGDIGFVNPEGFSRVIEGDKILGVETHSLSKPDAWKKAITSVRKWKQSTEMPSAFIMTTDGFANSFKSDEDYKKTCIDYYETLNEYGPRAVKDNLRKWLRETSEQGCGDDISMMIYYNYHDDAVFKPVPKEV